MLHGLKEKTAYGNPKPPPIDEYLNWILEAWNAVSVETIEKSFKVCGITNAIDGSEDDKIYCFKENGEVPIGKEMLAKAREKNSSIDKIVHKLVEIDLLQDDENGILDDYSLEL